MKSHNDNSEKIDRSLCNICSNTFANKYILKSHMKTHSEDSKEIERFEVLSCNVCERSFSNKYSLKYHKRSHEEDAKDKTTTTCDVCAKLVSKVTLKKHMRNIPGENKFVTCSNCGKSSRISCIKNHERMCKRTTEERIARRLKCDECGKGLSSRDKLRKHIRKIHHIEEISQ